MALAIYLGCLEVHEEFSGFSLQKVFFDCQSITTNVSLFILKIQELEHE